MKTNLACWVSYGSQHFLMSNEPRLALLRLFRLLRLLHPKMIDVHPRLSIEKIDAYAERYYLDENGN
jgi:hypothetical protein